MRLVDLAKIIGAGTIVLLAILIILAIFKVI